MPQARCRPWSPSLPRLEQASVRGATPRRPGLAYDARHVPMGVGGVLVMPSPVDRLRGAIWGQLVGDAAALGSHWIYDVEELRRRWPAEGHYHRGKRAGDLTHYGHAALLLLGSVAERGRFDERDFGGRFLETFESTAYHGYVDRAMRLTMANHRAFVAANPGAAFDFQQGAEDFEPATVSRLAPVAVAHRDDPELLKVVERATLVSQRHPRATAHAQLHALILRELFRGAALPEALARAEAAMPTDAPFCEDLRTELSAARGRSGEEVRLATGQLGQHCRLDQSFPSAVHCALRHQGDFRAAIVDDLRAGGDTAGRGSMIGAWLGASLGIAAIPAEWRQRLLAHDEIERNIERVVTASPAKV